MNQRLKDLKMRLMSYRRKRAELAEQMEQVAQCILDLEGEIADQEQLLAAKEMGK
jgi:hypothetical protein